MIKLSRFCFIAVFLVSSLSVAARRSKLTLDDSTLIKVNALLKETTDFQTALTKKDKDTVTKEYLELSSSISLILGSIGDFQVKNQGMHLKRILQSTKSHLESYHNLQNNDKKLKNLKKAFSQLVQLVRIYPVDKSFRIFYCKNDNSEWIQKGWKAQNPIHPDKHLTCGQRAYR